MREEREEEKFQFAACGEGIAASRCEVDENNDMRTTLVARYLTCNRNDTAIHFTRMYRAGGGVFNGTVNVPFCRSLI